MIKFCELKKGSIFTYNKSIYMVTQPVCIFDGFNYNSVILLNTNDTSRGDLSYFSDDIEVEFLI